MAFALIFPIRAIQALFALIVLGLTAYIAHRFHHRGLLSNTASPSQNSFLLFVSLWSFLALAYLTLTPMFMARLSHRVAIVAVEALTMLLWFIGFVALAVYVGNLAICVGHVCRALKAAVVFGAFEWALFLATTILAALEMRGTRTRTTKTTGSVSAFSNNV